MLLLEELGLLEFVAVETLVFRQDLSLLAGLLELHPGLLDQMHRLAHLLPLVGLQFLFVQE
jgi:hypothetical protein